MAFDISDRSVFYLLSCMASHHHLIERTSDFNQRLSSLYFINFCFDFLFRSGYCVVYDDISRKYKIFK